MRKTRSIFTQLLLSSCFLFVAVNSTAHIPGLGEDPRPSLAPILEDVKDAVVNISVTTRQEYRIPWFDNWQGIVPRRNYRDVQAAGSGVVIDAERGLVITNHHVIAQAHRVVITLQDKRSFDASFLGSDPRTDIALLKIDAPELVDLKLSDSDQLLVGDYVIAIGNPFGLGQTVTSGIVSALGRNQLNITEAEDFIQTDASINPGNSGGALIDIEGQLVGINTAIISPTGGSSGIGFAIPSNMVKAIVDQLVEFGDIKRGTFGIVIEPVTQDVARALGLTTNQGVVVTEVYAGTSADKAGMRIDDVITAFNGEQITNNADLGTKIALLRVGQDFDLTVIRSGREIQIEGDVQETNRGLELIPGIYVAEIPSSHPHYGRIRGVMVSSVDSRTTGSDKIQVGDIVLQVNRTGISQVTDLGKVNLDYRPLVLGIVRGTQEFRLVVRN